MCLCLVDYTEHGLLISNGEGVLRLSGWVGFGSGSGESHEHILLFYFNMGALAREVRLEQNVSFSKQSQLHLGVEPFRNF